MKKLAILALSVFVVASMSVPVLANDVVVSFDTAGTVGEATFAPFSQFSMYIIGQEIGDVTGWEIGMTFPPTLTVLGRVVNNGPGVNPGGDDNYLIGLGACYGDGAGTDYLFVTYNCGVFTNPVVDDQQLCLIPPNDGLPPASGFLAYTSCANEIVGMGAGNIDNCGGSNGCATVNPTAPGCVVATEQASWGAVKAAY
jgi:hypothetical protein